MNQTTEDQVLWQVANAARVEYGLREHADLTAEAYAELRPAELEALTLGVLAQLPEGSRASVAQSPEREARSPRWHWLLVALVPGLVTGAVFFAAGRAGREATIEREPRAVVTEQLVHSAGSAEQQRLRLDPQGWLCTDSAFVDTGRVAAGSDATLRDTLWLSVRPGIGEGGATLLQRVDAAPFRGLRVRLQARLATRDVLGGAGLWLRADAGQPPEHRVLVRAGRQPPPLLGTHEYESHEVLLDVPAEADALALGANITGSGQLWLDQVLLEVVPTTDESAAPSAHGTDSADVAAAPEPTRGRRRPLRPVP